MISNIKKFILFLLPLFYIIYIIYMRLFFVRKTRILYVELSNIQLGVTLLILLLIILRIIILLRKENIISANPPKSWLMLWCNVKLSKASKIFSELWVNFYRIFVAKIVIHQVILVFVKFLARHRNPKFVLIIILIFNLFPKVVLVITFLIDIYIYKEFFYFYKSLFLLLLPLIYTTVTAILSQYYTDNMAFFNDHVIETTVLSDCGHFLHTKWDLVPDYVLPSFVKDKNDFILNHYFPIYNLDHTLRFYEAAKSYYKINFIFILILILHFFGWLTILVFGITF